MGNKGNLQNAKFEVSGDIKIMLKELKCQYKLVLTFKSEQRKD